MKIEVNLKKKYFFPAVFVVIIVTGIFIAYALTAGTAPNPGHLLNQVSPPSGCLPNQYIKWNGSDLVCSSSTPGQAGTRTFYPLNSSAPLISSFSSDRYVFGIQDTILRVNRSTVHINWTLMFSLCADIDGCELTLETHDSLLGTERGAIGPYRFFSGDYGSWMLGSVPSVSGTDGDGVAKTVMGISNYCYLTDGPYINGVVAPGEPDQAGFELLLWANRTACDLIVTD